MKKSSLSNNYYEVDFELTLFFSQIYGEDEYYNFKEFSNLKDYKKQFRKLLITIEKSFLNSCLKTDNYHKNEIRRLVASEISIINKKKNVKDIYKSLIIFYPKLCFLLIGELPENYLKRNKSNRNSWILTNFRQIEYKQSKEQKRNQLIKLLKNSKIEGFDYQNIIEKYHNEKIESENFMDWLIRTYPSKYIELFN